MNWAFIVFLLLACLAPFVSPAVFWPLAFFGLLHPAFAIVNFLFLVLWIIRRKRRAFYSLAVLLLAIPYFGKQFNFSFGKPTPAPPGAFTVMSYNVKLFDLYNWTHNAETRAEIFEQIRNARPDILSIQEFYTQDSGRFQNLDSLKMLLQLPYVHSEYTVTLRKFDHWGVATFSRYPIVNQGKIVFNNRNNNICIYSDIVVNSDTIRVYNMHLQSISFGYVDMKFMKDVLGPEDAEDEMAASKNILRRMKRAYIKRANQAEAIEEHIASCPYPVIVCGDFNDTPISYAYRTISGGLDDAFYSGSAGFGKTFDNPLPGPRIDYILHSPSLHSFEFHVLRQEGLSDHYPVVCRMK